jgi:hypothetical protein
MSDFIQSVIDWIRRLFGWEPDPKAVHIEDGQRLFMPLFHTKLNGSANGTWNYLSLPPEEQANVRAYIKRTALPHETPAITFLLTPENCNGGVIKDKDTVLTDKGLAYLSDRCEELCADGIAVIPTLYCDDPSGDMPRWTQIERHKLVWQTISEAVGKYLSGVMLAIENNELATSTHHMGDCITVMRECFPGLQAYGTHLQWRGGGLNSYRWLGNTSTPANVDCILVETTWHPSRGDSVGVGGLSRELTDIVRACAGKKIAVTEYNLNVGSAVELAQREYLRGQKLWGVG